MTPVDDLLSELGCGDPTAGERLYAALYPEIKRLARAQLYRMGRSGRLDTTGLVHEGFLRLAEVEGLRASSRGEFFVYVGRVLRSVLIDLLRNESADKRDAGGPMLTLTFAGGEPASLGDVDALLGLESALRKMQSIDRELYELLEMNVFAGVSVVEIAEIRKTSARSVQRLLVKGRLLLRELMG